MHCCACTRANWANEPKLVSYPQMRKVGEYIGSLPATTHGQLRSHLGHIIATSSPTLTLVTSLPTA